MSALALLLLTQAVDRPQAPWPPPPGPLRMIIDTDAACEIDDHYALALALGFPERFAIEGIVAAHFAKPEQIEKSFKDVQLVLSKAGKTVPVKRGAPPMASMEDRPSAEGVDFIIERAKAATPENPLWLVLLGPATDGVLALEKDPSIADRVILFWHSRSDWPKKCLNFNAKNDRHAARRLFDQKSRLILFDTGAQLTLTMEESGRRFAPMGPLGAHLQEIRGRSPKWQEPKKGVFDLGDFAALIDPSCAPWERVAAPSVREDMTYDLSATRGDIVRIKDVDRTRSFDLLEEALRKLMPPKQNP